MKLESRVSSLPNSGGQAAAGLVPRGPPPIQDSVSCPKTWEHNCKHPLASRPSHGTAAVHGPAGSVPTSAGREVRTLCWFFVSAAHQPP